MRMGTTRPTSSVTQRIPLWSLVTASLLRHGGAGQLLHALELGRDLRCRAGRWRARRPAHSLEPVADLLDETSIDASQGQRIAQYPRPMAVILGTSTHGLVA